MGKQNKSEANNMTTELLAHANHDTFKDYKEALAMCGYKIDSRGAPVRKLFVKRGRYASADQYSFLQRIGQQTFDIQSKVCLCYKGNDRKAQTFIAQTINRFESGNSYAIKEIITLSPEADEAAIAKIPSKLRNVASLKEVVETLQPLLTSKKYAEMVVDCKACNDAYFADRERKNANANADDAVRTLSRNKR